MYPEDLKYSTEHFWVKIDGSKARIGITYFYQKQLEKIVYIDLPKAGITLIKGEPFGSIESSKTINDMISPVSGKVIEINSTLQDKPDTVSKDPYGAGWMVLLEMGNPDEAGSLISAGAYESLVSKK